MVLSESTKSTATEIALNATRTRVTVLASNLTIISVMLSVKVGSGEIEGKVPVLSFQLVPRSVSAS